MKKIIPLFALVPVLFLVGCNQNQNPNGNPSTNAPSSASGYTTNPPVITSTNMPQPVDTNNAAGMTNSNGQ